MAQVAKLLAEEDALMAQEMKGISASLQEVLRLPKRGPLREGPEATSRRRKVLSAITVDPRPASIPSNTTDTPSLQFKAGLQRVVLPFSR